MQYLRERLAYDPSTGIFLWRCRPVEHFVDAPHCNTWNTRYANKPAGAMTSNGYLKIVIDDRAYMAHRMAWLMFYEAEVQHDIDHIDGDRTNNRIVNLRQATRAENLANSRVKKSNTGVKGVWFDRGRRKFSATITHLYKQHYLGRFDTLEQARAARRVAAERLQGKFVRHE